MSHREGQELQPGYMDGVCVKISEKYKPPPKINLAVTYSQRLSLNSQIRDGMRPYDFSLETKIKERVKELRNARKLIHEERKDRLEKIKEARQKYEEDKATKLSEKINVSDKEKEIFSVSSELNETEARNLDSTQVPQIISAPATINTGVLYPTSYSHILTPTPLTTNCTSQAFTCKPSDKSPFNISEFEADTSSPFDNMELKTINDIEELAQVLKKDDSINTSFNTPYTVTQIYSNYVPLPSISTHSNIHSNYIPQETLNTNQHYATYSTIPHPSVTSIPSYGQPTATTMYNNLNGYYYTSDVLQSNLNFRPFTYNNIQSDNSSDSSPPQTKIEENKKSAFRSVPDIMKALEAELDNTHIYKTNHHTPIIENHQHKVTRPMKSEDSSDEQITKCAELEDPYELLPKNLQHLSKNISLMGFPLPRVARACKALGEDHKKVKLCK